MAERKHSLGTQKRADLIFYICLMAFPVVQFFLMYICVNFNSILLSFQYYDLSTNTYSFAKFDNFKTVFYLLFETPDIGNSWKNSFILYLTGPLISTPLTLLFSYYIHKKLFLSKAFKVLLFLPSVCSVVVMAILYKYFILNALPELWLKLFHKEIVLEIGFVELVFFGMLMGIGPNILMYVGAMGGISESLSESAQLDGCGLMQEFWYITLPCVYPTLVTFLVVGLVNIFTNQLNLYNFYQGSANTNLYTFGYYLFRGAQRAQSVAEYPVLAAMGIIFTIVIVPVTLLFRKLLVKFGPSAD